MRLSHPLFSGPQRSGGSVFDFRAHFCHSAPMETHAFGFRLRANAPEGQKRFPIRKSRKLYDQHAASQRGAQPKTTAAPSMRNMQMGAWILRALGAKANELASVVELGFGDAELSRVLASVLPQASIVACDIARDRVAAATELAAQLGLAQRVECRVLDFDSDLGLLHDGAADLVVSIDVLEHVFDVFNFVGHVARIVRPGGLGPAARSQHCLLEEPCDLGARRPACDVELVRPRQRSHCLAHHLGVGWWPSPLLHARNFARSAY